MREAHPVERAVGMAYYVSDADGIGGRLRETDADFRVRELERFDAESIDADTDDYPHLVVRATLHGWDTNDFARRLSDALGISRERIAWAGTKDKHAVTTQLFSIAKVDPDDLPEIDGVDLTVVGRAGRALTFGDLAGNEFEIVVNGVEAPERVDAVTAELERFGGGAVAVPNYFGQQRFGSRRPVTHEVGLAIVRGEWKEAVVAYVGNPFETEPETTRSAREYIEREVQGSEEPDWEAALERFPRRLGFERSMLHRLVESGGSGEADFRDALTAVPSNLQRMFVNAAQSYAFNRMLSERLRRGLPFDRAVAGDVACFADLDAPNGIELPDVDRRQRVDADRVDAVNRHCERGRAFVTAPLVGTETELADGEQGEIERSVLNDLDIEPADFDLPDEFRSNGTRRAILLRTDLTIRRDPVTFEFALPSGSYATVVLREYLKGNPMAFD